MPALDTCQDQVILALQKAGWTVSPKPKRLIVGRRVAYIDLVASQGSRKIYVEVKCFTDPDSTHEQYVAVGQYLAYKAMLHAIEDSTPLYLTIPSTIMDSGTDPIFHSVLEGSGIHLLIVDIELEIVLQWKE